MSSFGTLVFHWWKMGFRPPSGRCVPGYWPEQELLPSSQVPRMEWWVASGCVLGLLPLGCNRIPWATIDNLLTLETNIAHKPPQPWPSCSEHSLPVIPINHQREAGYRSMRKNYTIALDSIIYNLNYYFSVLWYEESWELIVFLFSSHAFMTQCYLHLFLP